MFGVPCAVKDNIDVFDFDTTGACPKFIYQPKEDATTVKLLKQAGAIVVGKTNLDQFATGLVGTRSPYGITPNAFSKKHVSGGSSAGSGSTVSRGLVPFSLGTDTAGSGRVPASLNNIVGLKPTCGAFSCKGVIPACKSLDCVSVFALNLKDAQLVFSIMAHPDDDDEYSRPLPPNPLRKFGKNPKFAVPKNPNWYGDLYNDSIFNETILNFKKIGVQIEEIDFDILFKLAKCLYEGPWVAERYSATKKFLNSHSKDDFDPTVYEIIKSAEKFTASDAFDYEYLRKSILKEVSKKYDSYDGFLVPTCPLFPTIESVLKEPIKINSIQGTYTNFVNLSDKSALAIPVGFRSDGFPFGVTLISDKFNDYALLDLASRYLTEITPTRTIGNLSNLVADGDSLHPTIPLISENDVIKLAVVGGHLSGMALHWQLEAVNAYRLCKTTTSENYRLYALPNTVPAKPGLRRVLENGKKIAVEVYAIPKDLFGKFIAMVPAPLGIGNVELSNRQYVKGFICEEAGYLQPGTRDITEFGGWRLYIASLNPLNSKKKPFKTVLVANRGEIAVRIIKTLKKLDIKSIAVYSDVDKYSKHVLLADDSIALNGNTASETYLSIPKIISAAKQTKSDAIIPGYGFLSENADFSDKCLEEGIVFVGPTGEAIRKLGLKHSARQIAEAANVPLVPGSGLVDTIEEAIEIAKKLTYPIMVKSTAGGGGIGLQRVDNEKELITAFATVKHQGISYFGDGGVFLERFVENARHVEIQMFGDGYGKAIALGERDCSLQRRNQKVIEETPAPNLPELTRQKMRKASEQLGSSMNYKCAGTVEFIYDSKRDEFYFLEVNARLQVEHPITEMVTGLDLVEWMLYIAADMPPDFNQKIEIKGAAMEARLYAENPVKDFLPSPGQITEVKFPDWARIDGWVEKGTTISAEYDPTIAKIIVHGKDRADALKKLNQALEETVVYGVVTNVDYLRSIAKSDMFNNAQMFTKVLDTYEYSAKAIEITVPGSYTTVQDYPGRIKLWRNGVPPSGPMDDYSFRIANKIVGNDNKAPAIECTLNGPSILFHSDSIVSVTGGEAPIKVDDVSVNMWEPIHIKKGSKLVIGKLSTGCRCYIAIRGGIDVPEYLGSRSTFALGTMGGFNGRVLKFGDVLFLGQPEIKSCTIPIPISEPKPIDKKLIPTYSKNWTVAVTSGPHGSPDFFKPSSIKTFFESEWKVHYNSNRFGVRLIGPKPEWSRPDGGEAGLHPSNAHDYVYAMGAINFTGDEPVILTCDGPSLGGFVCAAVVIESEMWKIGQAKPGDLIKFVPITYEKAIELKKTQDLEIESMAAIKQFDNTSIIKSAIPESQYNPILYSQEPSAENPLVTYRQAGDRYILVEYGENIMDLNLSYRVFRLQEKITSSKLPGIVEMSQGVRSVLIQYNNEISQKNLLDSLVKFEKQLLFDKKWKVPSRIIKLPMCFEDKKTLEAVKRYQETIRSTAPWLPNNVDFIASVNNMDRNEVKELLYVARFLVLGLGDVFLGAPCAVPLDPRHRLIGTKYNPSRSFTPNGTVGIGGMYMCIYTMESPGGYQLVGRTIPIWDKLTLGQQDRPWLLNVFDQVEFYPVSEEELDVMSNEVNNGEFHIDIQDSIFDHEKYLHWIESNIKSITEHVQRQGSELEEFNRLIQISNSELQGSLQTEEESISLDQFEEGAEFIYSEFSGRFWKSLVSVNDKVTKGQGIIAVEAMKTEMVVGSPRDGKVIKILHKNGDMIEAGDLVAVII